MHENVGNRFESIEFSSLHFNFHLVQIYILLQRVLRQAIQLGARVDRMGGGGGGVGVAHVSEPGEDVCGAGRCLRSAECGRGAEFCYI